MLVLQRSLLGACLIGAVACGSSQAATRPAETPASVSQQSAPPPPPVPQDPIDLIPSDAALLINARIEVMKDRNAFASLRRAAQRYGCLSDADFDWFTAQTQRAVATLRGERDSEEFLVVLAGQYADADAARALDALAQRAGGGDPPATRTHGRFSVTQKGPLSASVLEGRLLIAGNDAFVISTLDAIDRPPAERYAQTEIVRDLGEHIQCFDRSVCGLITRDGPAAQRLKGELAGVGMKKVGRDLAGSHSGMTLAVGDGVRLGVVARTQNDEQADALAKATRDWLWQAALVARLAGFPDVLGDAEVKTDGAFAEIKIKVGDDDMERLEKRIYQLLGNEAATCPAPVARIELAHPSPLVAASP